MYKIEQKEYGLHVTMGGVYEASEIERYIAEKEGLLSNHEKPYSMVVDLRTAIPPEHKDVIRLKESQEKMRKEKLQRMAIIIASPVLMAQAKQVAFMSGIEENTRFINAAQTPDWEARAIAWAANGLEP